MTIDFCKRCQSASGTLCVTCGESRSFRDPARHRGSTGGKCARRGNATKPCPVHTEPTIRCDYCTIVVSPAVQRDGQSYWYGPASWGVVDSKDACPHCYSKLAIAVDAVLECDFRSSEPALRRKLVDQLLHTLSTIESAKDLEPAGLKVFALKTQLARVLGIACDREKEVVDLMPYTQTPVA